MPDDRKHDQKFVNNVIKEGITFEENSYLVIGSDYCKCQYKSVEHFADLQNISDKVYVPIIRVFGIAGHRKGEVDHVGGLAKILIRHKIANGGYLEEAADMVQFLGNKFRDYSNPPYHVKEINCKELEVDRMNAKYFYPIAQSRVLKCSRLLSLLQVQKNLKQQPG